MEIQNSVPVQTPTFVSKFNLKKSWPLVLGSFLVVIAGVLTAWLISGGVAGGTKSIAPGAKVTAKEAGFLDADKKYANAVGTLVAGGTGNEGTHHLDREGGVSQTVYLTSSVIDLESFVGKKIEVWGETLASKKAGWLMDVVKIKVTD